MSDSISSLYGLKNMADALRQGVQKYGPYARLTAELLDPTPVSDAVAIVEEPTNPLNYLAAIPLVGNAAVFAKAAQAARRGKFDPDMLPEDVRYRFDEDATDEDIKRVFAEEFITELEANDVKGLDIVENAEQVADIDQGLYDAISKEMPDYMKNIDATEELPSMDSMFDDLVSELQGEATDMARKGEVPDTPKNLEDLAPVRNPMDEEEFYRRVQQGYPEGTAERIARGELPMDPASRMQRMQEQGWGFRGYHTGTPTFNKMHSSDQNFLFMSPEAPVSNSYHAPLGYNIRSATFPLATRDLSRTARMDAGGNRYDELLGKELDYRGQKYNLDAPTTDMVAHEASKKGVKEVQFDNIIDTSEEVEYVAPLFGGDRRLAREALETPHTVIATTRPVRSMLSAAFDPDEINSRNILAGAGALSTTALLAALMRQQEQQREEL